MTSTNKEDLCDKIVVDGLNVTSEILQEDLEYLDLSFGDVSNDSIHNRVAAALKVGSVQELVTQGLTPSNLKCNHESPLHSLLGLFYSSMATDMRSAAINISPSPSRSLSRSSNQSAISGCPASSDSFLVDSRRASTPVNSQFYVGYFHNDPDINDMRNSFCDDRDSLISEPELVEAFKGQQTMDILAATGRLDKRREEKGGYGTPSSYASEQEMNLYFVNSTSPRAPYGVQEDETPTEITSDDFKSAQSSPGNIKWQNPPTEDALQQDEPRFILKMAAEKFERTIQRLEDFTSNICKEGFEMEGKLQKSGSHANVRRHLKLDQTLQRRNSEGSLVKSRIRKSEDRLMKMLQMASDSVIDNDVSSAVILNITTPNKDETENLESKELRGFSEFRKCLQELDQCERLVIPQSHEKETDNCHNDVFALKSPETLPSFNNPKPRDTNEHLPVDDDNSFAEARNLMDSLINSIEDDGVVLPLSPKSEPGERSHTEVNGKHVIVESEIQAVDASKQEISYQYFFNELQDEEEAEVSIDFQECYTAENASLPYGNPNDSIPIFCETENLEVPENPSLVTSDLLSFDEGGGNECVYPGNEVTSCSNENSLQNQVSTENTDLFKNHYDVETLNEVTNIIVKEQGMLCTTEANQENKIKETEAGDQKIPERIQETTFENKFLDEVETPIIKSFHDLFTQSDGSVTPLYHGSDLDSTEIADFSSPGLPVDKVPEQKLSIHNGSHTRDCQILLDSEEFLQRTSHDLDVLQSNGSFEWMYPNKLLDAETYSCSTDGTAGFVNEKCTFTQKNNDWKEPSIPSIVITSPKTKTQFSYQSHTASKSQPHDNITNREPKDTEQNFEKDSNETFAKFLPELGASKQLKIRVKPKDKPSKVSALNFCDEFWVKYNILEDTINDILKPSPPKIKYSYPKDTVPFSQETVTFAREDSLLKTASPLIEAAPNSRKTRHKVSFDPNTKFPGETLRYLRSNEEKEIILEKDGATQESGTKPNLTSTPKSHCASKDNVLSGLETDETAMTLSRNFLNSVNESGASDELMQTTLPDHVTAMDVSSSLGLIKRNLRHDLLEADQMQKESRRHVQRICQIQNATGVEQNLMQATARTRATDTPRNDLLTHLDDLYVERDQLKKKIEVCKRDREDAEKAAQKAKQDLQFEQDHADTRLENMKNSDNGKGNIKKRVEELESLSKASTSDLERAEFDLKSFERDRFSIPTENDHSLVDLKADNSIMREKLDRMHEISAENLLLQSDLADYQAELAELRTEAKELRSKCYEISEENRQHKSEIRDLRRYIELLKANKTGDCRQDLLNKIEYYQMEHDRLLDEVRRLKQRLGDVSPRSPRNRSVSPRPSSRHSYVSSSSPSKQNVRFSSTRARSPVTDAMAASSASSHAASRLIKDRSISPSAALNIRDLTMERYNQHMDGPDSPRSIDSDCTEVLLKPQRSQMNGCTAVSGVKPLGSEDEFADTELSLNLKKRGGRATDSSGSFRETKMESSPVRRSCSPCASGFRSVSPKMTSTQKDIKDTARDRYPTMVKRSLPRRAFAPRSPGDLMLGYCIKFTRPGGKLSRGTVRYIGHLPTRDEMFVGVELDGYDGKHAGTFQGTKYFTCSPNKGIFTPFSKVIMAWE